MAPHPQVVLASTSIEDNFKADDTNAAEGDTRFLTPEAMTKFSKDSPTNSAGMLIMGAIIGMIFFVLCYCYLRRCCFFRANRNAPLRYVSMMYSSSPSRIRVRSSDTTWSAPPPYEQRQNIPAAHLSTTWGVQQSQLEPLHPGVAQVNIELRSLTSGPRSHPHHNNSYSSRTRMSSAFAAHRKALRRIETEREIIIRMERDQALLRLEGNPLGGQHITNVTEEGFRKFLTETRLNTATSRAETTQITPLTEEPIPMKLRGGGGGRSLGNNSVYSADDIAMKIKDWYRRQATREDTKAQKRLSQHGHTVRSVRCFTDFSLSTWLRRKRTEAKEREAVSACHLNGHSSRERLLTSRLPSESDCREALIKLEGGYSQWTFDSPKTERDLAQRQNS